MHTIKLTDLVSQSQYALENGEPIDVPCDGCNQCCMLDVTLTPAEQVFFGVEKFTEKNEDGTCLYYQSGCTIYDHRPLVCKQFDCRSNVLSSGLWIKAKITPTTELGVVIDDREMLYLMLLTAREIIDMVTSGKIKTDIWRATMINMPPMKQRISGSFNCSEPRP